MDKKTFVKETTQYVQQRYGFWYVLGIGIFLTALFFGLSFVSDKLQTVAGVAAAITIVVCVMYQISAIKMRPPIINELKSLVATQVIDIKPSGRHGKYLLKDLTDAVKLVREKFNIPIEKPEKPHHSKA